MPRSNQDQIRSRIEAFVNEIAELIRESALESVQAALGRQATATPRRRTAGKVARAKPAGRKRIRRSAADVQQQAAAALAEIKSNPGKRLGDIAKSLRLETKDVRRPVGMLLEAGKVRTEGQRGGTRYYPGKRGAGGKTKVVRKAARKVTKRGRRKKRSK